MARRQRKPVVGKPPAVTDPAAAKLFINRELSWLGFNERVLEEARDPTVPLAERLKFVAIVASNLDEFFMVRVAGLKQQLSGEVEEPPPDGMMPQEQLAAVSARTHKLVDAQYHCWTDQLVPALAREGVMLVKPADLAPELVVLPLDPEGFRLTYRIRAKTPLDRMVYFIDANTGVPVGKSKTTFPVLASTACMMPGIDVPTKGAVVGMTLNRRRLDRVVG